MRRYRRVCGWLRCHRFRSIDDLADETQKLLFDAQIIRIHNAAGRQKCVVVGGLGGIERDIHRDLHSPVVDIPTLDLGTFGDTT
jgi:hypothetical protein